MQTCCTVQRISDTNIPKDAFVRLLNLIKCLRCRSWKTQYRHCVNRWTCYKEGQHCYRRISQHVLYHTPFKLHTHIHTQLLIAHF